MTTKYTPLNKIQSPLPLSPVRNSAFRFCFGTYTGFLPTRIPLHVSNLKPKTRYKVFIRSNDDQGPQEDVTSFCRAVGASLTDNQHADDTSYLISSDSGSLTVEVASIGTSTIDPSINSWAAYWRHLPTKSPVDDLNRSDFIIVEYNLVEEPSSPSKYKIINTSNPPSVTTPLISESAEDQYVRQEFIADYVQTFFVDPNAVENSKTVDLTSVSVYFRTKPEQRNNKSGINSPGVTVALIDVENDDPITSRQYKGSVVQKTWGAITTTADATAATKFSFDDVVRVIPGKFYAIAVAFEDPDYDVWSCRVGDLLVGTNTPSSGPSKDHRGSLFQLTNQAATLTDTNFDTLYTAQADRDLKFDIEVARYDTSNPIQINMINRPMEFLSIGLNNGNWVGSEYVYVDRAGFTVPNLSITAGSYEITFDTSASFEGIGIGETFIVREGLKTAVLTFEFIDTSSTTRTATLIEPSPLTFTSAAEVIRTAIAVVDYFDPYNNELFLLDSSARPGFLFSVGNAITGVESRTSANITAVNEFPISVFSTNLDLELPNDFSVDPTYQFAITGESGFTFRPDQDADPTLLREPNYITSYRANILSRSLEIDQATNLNNDVNDPYSAKHTLTFTRTGGRDFRYTSPEIEVNTMSLVSHFWVINNNAANEHTNQGDALTKHISNKLTFDRGEAAEDIRVVVNAYKPVGTDILLYAKILNNQDGDAFDDKNWSPLVITSGEGQISSSNNQYDYREFEYGFPSNLNSSSPHPGAFTSTLDSADIVCTDTVALGEGDIIKLYNPTFKEQNYGIFSVEAVNSNTVTLNEPIETSSMVGTDMRVDTVVELPHTGFNNPLNEGIVRYFDFESAPHDGYSTVAIKIVLLAESTTLVPKVDDYRVVGVTV